MNIQTLDDLVSAIERIVSTARAADLAHHRGFGSASLDAQVAAEVLTVTSSETDNLDAGHARLLLICTRRIVTGATYAEIGSDQAIFASGSVSRERVRQLCATVGLASREDLRAIRASLLRADLDSALEEALTAESPPSDYPSLAKSLAVSLATLRENLSDCQTKKLDERFARTRKRENSWSVTKWTEQEFLNCLREAAGATGKPEGPLTASTYKKFAASQAFADGRDWPGPQTVMKRFGSWREAVLQAGLAANKSSPVAGQTTYTREDVLHAVRSAALTFGVGHSLSVNQYDAWAREQKRIGVANAPSTATVRKYASVGWQHLVEEALSL